MNGLYARDTSNKNKEVKLSTFKAGKYVGCYAPLGYRKSALILNAEKIPAPRTFYCMAKDRGESPGRIAVLERCDGKNACSST